MASITSLMNSSSSTSSIYGNRNVISGLASGMDTESMIENSISGYKAKITSLQKRMTKMQWKQDAYRSMIVQMNNILSKYTSYTSSTNLFSSSFFSKAVNTVANGANAAAVSVTGKSSSNVAINRIKQLAEAASYTVGTSDLVSEGSKTEAINLSGNVDTSSVSGSIAIKYGGGKTGKGSTFTLRFTEDEVYNSARELADAINEKLKSNNITTSGGSTSADNYIQARVNDDNQVVLEDKRGNYFAITGVTGDMAKLFSKGEAETLEGSSNRGFASESIATNFADPDAEGVKLVNTQKTQDYLSGKSISVTLDGKSKSIKLDDVFNSEEYKKAKDAGEGDTAAFAAGLNAALNKEFGNGKIQVSVDSTTNGLKFTDGNGKAFGKGTTFKVAGSSDSVNKALGLGEGGYSNTLQTSWTLEKVLGNNKVNWKNETDSDGKTIKTAEITVNGKSFTFKSTDTVKDLMDKISSDEEAGVDIKYSSLTGNFAITAKETGSAGQINISGELGEALFGTKKEIKEDTTTFNDAFGAGIENIPAGRTNIEFRSPFGKIGISVEATDTIDDVVEKLNNVGNTAHYGENISFNKDTLQFEYTKSDGTTSNMSFGKDTIGDLQVSAEYAGSSGTFTAGKDAVFTATVNGEEIEMTRSSNTVDLDGMQVTLKNSFGYNEDGTVDNSAEKITFTTTSDSDKIIDAVKSFIEDYNKLVTEMHSAYRTEALKNSSGNAYEPLTDDDMSGMSESSIKAYEDKAKTGILYGDQDVSNLYNKLTEAVQSSGQVGAALRSMGITVEFSNGLSTLSLDEDAFRSALESDPDKVKNAFTQSTANGASQDGLMAGLKNTLEMYGSTSIANPGILVNKAGSELSSYSLSHNEIQDQLDSIQEQIEKWQEKMSERVDYYTNKFTALEQLINQMNSQSSMLSSMMGG